MQKCIALTFYQTLSCFNGLAVETTDCTEKQTFSPFFSDNVFFPFIDKSHQIWIKLTRDEQEMHYNLGITNLVHETI